MVLASLPPSDFEPGSDTDSVSGVGPVSVPPQPADRLPPSTLKDEPTPPPARAAHAEPGRLMPLLVRTVILALAAILLVYAVLPALLRMV